MKTGVVIHQKVMDHIHPVYDEGNEDYKMITAESRTLVLDVLMY